MDDATHDARFKYIMGKITHLNGAILRIEQSMNDVKGAIDKIENRLDIIEKEDPD